jgi:hypothetical protein
MENLNSTVGKECLSATFEKSTNTSALTLKTDDCTVKKRVICEVCTKCVCDIGVRE